MNYPSTYTVPAYNLRTGGDDHPPGTCRYIVQGGKPAPGVSQREADAAIARALEGARRARERGDE